MIKTKWFSLLRWTHVVFGSGYLDRFILIEVKHLFSIYFNVWNTIEHDRFHTHAFSAISLMIWGHYYEENFESGLTYKIQAPTIRVIPRTNNHRMLRSSSNAISLTIAGPWDRLWSETFLDGSRRILSWGRKVVVTERGYAENDTYLPKDRQING